MKASRGWTAVIPIRNGSKGVPGKNTRLLAGKALYEYTLDLALDAGAECAIISTDIPEVLNATHRDKRVRVLPRPAPLCGDEVQMAPVLEQALRIAGVTGPAVLLQATSPLRHSSDVQSALELLATGKYQLVMSVSMANSEILKWGKLDGERFIPLSSPEHCFSNRQSLPCVVKPNGAIYAVDSQMFLEKRTFACERIGVILMPPERSYDIDTYADFERCESLIRVRSAKK